MDFSNGGGLVLIFGAPGCGKTSAVEHIILKNIGQFRYGVIFDSAKSEEASYRFWPSNLIHESFSEDMLRTIMNKQTKIRSGEKDISIPLERRTKMFIVLDDMAGSIKFNTAIWTQLVNRRRHYGIVLLVVIHTIKSIPPLFRDGADYAILFYIRTKEMIDKAYEMCAPAFDSKDNFKQVLTTIKPKDKKDKGNVLIAILREGTSFNYKIPNPTGWKNSKVLIGT